MIRPKGIASRFLAVIALFAVAFLLGLFVIGPVSEWRSSVLQRASTRIDDIERLDLSAQALTAEMRALSGSQRLDLMWSAEQSGQTVAPVHRATAKSRPSDRTRCGVPYRT
jgi:hypothetical protein